MKRHFLIIDDDEDELMFFVEALEHVGISFKCTWAKSGEHGLQQLAYITPDIIFVDYNMPGMNGLECLKAIRALASCRSIPIIVHSNKMEPQIQTKALELGATACISKPESLQWLIHFLKSFLAEHVLI
jgi:CheY-like chemotaxis protein